MNLEEILLNSHVGDQWEKIGVRHHHGIDIALSSIHSKNSCGIGEFYDLLPLIDWCHAIGMDVIQLLPLNDTGDDPSPYFAVSALALNPLFISLYKLKGVLPKDLEELKRFTKQSRVPYHDVQSHKLLFLRAYFEKEGASIIQKNSFQKYVEENDWVETYALFKVLKDQLSKNHWKKWPFELQNISQDYKDELIENNWTDVCFYIFLQYLCYQQLTDVKAYAHSKGVFLKGDIPILISPDSADVWEYEEEFDLSYSAGAPPDAYNDQGQVWGLPIFKWDIMEARSYDWWKRRLSYASHFYDIYRIDHVLGFYRIWAIPNGHSSLEGIFIPQDEKEWIPHGEHLLTALTDFSPMLPIAEDLGDVPDAVRNSLSNLGICGTKVPRWEKEWADGQEFIDPKTFNPVSLSTVSTHDSETLALMWRDEPKEAKPYALYKGWEYLPKLTKDQQREFLRDSHQSASLFHINLLGEYLALFPELVSENPFDERINVPGTVSSHNWTYRMRPSVEEILAHEPLAEEMHKILE